ncbi:Serine/threonine-protein kinase MST20 [Purpureocillium lavendulum]|uniref:Serine/threonine-protein kinase MST20 n=1 Tax=Purpureocillium lavendulum TaxID=1247861 RepID=A0AB34FFS1_9HYPO|nr:Serine/threonine-protein kinase MST20 [Purpureocillium lavendulum]
MPRLHEYYYDDPYYDLDDGRRRPPSTSRHRADGFVHALEQGRVYEAGDIAKSALMPRSEHRHNSHERGSRREHHGHRGGNSLARTDERHYTYDQDPNARLPRLRSADGRQTLDRHHQGQHSRQDHHDRRRHSSAGGSSGNSFAEAATAAAAAGLVEAVRARHNPDRSSRAVTAAVGAAAVDALVSKGGDRNRGRHIAESAIGGLAIDRIANGSSKGTPRYHY